MANNYKKNETAESHITAGKDNYNFVQLSRGYLAQMRKLAKKSPLAHEILYYLVEKMGKNTNAVVVSYKTLCEVTGVSRPTVGRALKILRDDNWVATVRVGSATAYCVNSQVFWASSRNQKQYAIFSATVIASETEQESDFREKAKETLIHVPHVRADETTVVGTDELPPPDQQDLSV